MKVIQKYHNDFLNGPGMREVIFFSGCDNHCDGCFNKETADPNMKGARDWTEEDYIELKNNLNNYWIKGVTFTGGDPLSRYNYLGVLDLCRRLKNDIPDKTIMIYSGYTMEYIKTYIPSILDYIDILADGPFIKNLASPKKPWVGSSNQNVWYKENNTWTIK